MPALVLVQLELRGRLPHLGKDLGPGYSRRIDNDPGLIDAESIVFGVGGMLAVVLCMLLKFNDFNDFDYLDGFVFGLVVAVHIRFHKNGLPRPSV